MGNKSDNAVIEVYAQALFLEAQKQNVLKDVTADVELAEKTLLADKRFRVFLDGPHICTTEKHKMVDKIMKGRFHQLVLNLVHIALDKNHPEILDKILYTFQNKVDRSHNILPALIVSAVELSNNEKDGLQKQLEGLVKKKLHLRYKINPETIGGVIFRCEDMMIDQSIMGQLHKIQDQLKFKINLNHI